MPSSTSASGAGHMVHERRQPRQHPTARVAARPARQPAGPAPALLAASRVVSLGAEAEHRHQ
eukprot:1125805-Alexandrium_andersonii.AAC.1